MWFAILILFSSVSAEALPQGPLEVAISEVEPFAYRNKKALQGINYELLQELAQKSGVKFNYTLYPHIRLSNALEATGPDIAMMFDPACKKQKSYESAGIVYATKPWLYVKESKASAKDLRIGRILGTCGYVSEKMSPAATISELTDMSQGIDMLRAGRLDAVCGLKPVVESSLKRRRKLREKLILHSLDMKPVDAVICRKKTLSPRLKAKLDAGLKQMKAPTLD